MDPISTARVPLELMAGAADNLNNPLMFGMPIAMLGEDAAELAVTSVICTVADYLAGDEVQQRIGERLDGLIDPVLPADPYERRMALGAIAEAVAYVIGSR